MIKNKWIEKANIHWKSDSSEAILIQSDTFQVLRDIPSETFDMIFADPPYFLSNDGVTCVSGKMVSVNKGKWDRGHTIEKTHEFNKKWLKECQRILTDNGTIWISGTFHNIFSVGLALQELNYKIINDIKWYKRNAPPHLARKAFAHSTETIIWAAKSKNSKYYFNYDLMKTENYGKQKRDMWEPEDSWGAPPDAWDITRAPMREKQNGKHPTQKPVALLERIVKASTRKGDFILDPFTGSSTTGVAAVSLGRRFVGIDNEKEYLDISVGRLNNVLAVVNGKH